jgi:hypothetical protein
VFFAKSAEATERKGDVKKERAKECAVENKGGES